MFNISSYLEKFKSLGVKELLLKEKIVTNVKNVAGITITPKDVAIKNGIVTLKISPMEKSELFMKKNKILLSINEEIAPPLKDIR